MPIVEFRPLGLKVQVPAGTTILEAARQVARGLGDWCPRSTCGGHGTCGQCRVEVEGGQVTGVSEAERDLLARSGSGPGQRLACRAKVLEEGPVLVRLDRGPGGDKLQVSGTLAQVAPAPAVSRQAYALDPPAAGEKLGDADRLAATLGEKLGGPGRAVGFDLEVLRDVSGQLEKGRYRGWAILRGREVVALTPAAREGDAAPRLLGLAVDLGTTKIAGYLVDLETGEILEAAASLNPQIAFGQDVIARLGYAAASAENYRRIREAVVSGLNDLAEELCRRAGRTPGDIHDAVIAGNTAMHHLLLGLGVEQLGRAPYVPALTDALDVKARDLGLTLAGGAYVHLLPCVAGYVGGDHVAVLLATGVAAERAALAIDVGTNTEIALAQSGRVVCCSCASGPAFEGGQVSRGMRALDGAIDRVWLHGDRLRYSVVGGGKPVGFCGAALVDLLAVLLRRGVMDASGRLRRQAPGVREGPDGLYFEVGGVPLTQRDIRQLQLAKAAVRSGLEALLRAAGTTVGEVSRVYLAGAFGTAISPESAMDIGMFPRFPPGVYQGVGNAAGMGACLALVSLAKRDEARRLARGAGYLELVTLPGYQDLFLESVNLPAPA